MPRLRYISRPMIRMVYKMRHHRGHGIHSPFLFSLITKVIEEKDYYYAYIDIDEFLKESPSHNKTSTKQDRLLFRLVNFFSAKNILEIGAKSGVSTLYLTAASQKIECISSSCKVSSAMQQYIEAQWNRNISFYFDLPPVGTKQDCIVIDMRDIQFSSSDIYTYVCDLIHDKSFVVLRNIRTNKEAELSWKQFRVDQRTTLSLDLYNMGILFFNPKLFRRNYIISF